MPHYKKDRVTTVGASWLSNEGEVSRRNGPKETQIKSGFGSMPMDGDEPISSVKGG